MSDHLPREHRTGPEQPLPAGPGKFAGAVAGLRPELLYKAVALLFLFAVLLHYLEPLVRTLLLAYAVAILAVLFNAVVQPLPGGRTWVTALLGLVILASAAALLYFGLPVLIGQVRDLIGRAPHFAALVENTEAWILNTTGLRVNLVGSEVKQYLRSAFLSGGGGGEVLARAQGLLGALLIPLIVLFGALYAVARPNEDLLLPLLRVVPRDRRPAFRRILELLGDRLRGWAKGILIGMVAVGILSYVGYRVAGVPNALALAVVAGLTEAVPLLGPWIGGAIATTVGFLEGPQTGLYAAIVAIAVQQLENNLIIPWAMSQAADIHPLITLLALFLFGSLFGFVGVLLSIPLVLLIGTVVQVLWVERAIDTDEDRIAPVVEE